MHGLKEIICISCYFLSIRADAAQVCALYPDVKKKNRKWTAEQDWFLGSIKTWMYVSAWIFLNYLFFSLWAILAAVHLGKKR